MGKWLGNLLYFTMAGLMGGLAYGWLAGGGTTVQQGADALATYECAGKGGPEMVAWYPEGEGVYAVVSHCYNGSDQFSHFTCFLCDNR